MATTFTLSILTPEGSVFEDSVEAVVAPAAEGYLGVLAGHAPMLVALQEGILEVTLESGDKLLFESGEGTLEVTTGGCFILVDNADHSESTDKPVLSW